MVRVVRDPEPTEAQVVDETGTLYEKSEDDLKDTVARGFLATFESDEPDEPFATVKAEMELLKELLNQPLDRSLLKQRKGYGRDDNGQQKMLDYLEWHTITRQLNRLFGPSNWSWEVASIQTLGADEDSGVPCAVTAIATLTVTWPNGRVTSYTNDGMEVVKRKEIWENRRPTGRYEPRTWDALEMAYKGAPHDALKRCATALGEQFGLSLYAKEEEGKKVVEAVDAAETTTARSAATPSGNAGSKSQWQKNTNNTNDDDYDPDADYTAHCEDCGKDIHGYKHKQTGRVYTTDDLVNISKKTAGGRVLCYNCRTNTR